MSLRAELGMPDDEQAAAARRRLTAAGFRANLRQDYGAAVSLFERAAALEPATGSTSPLKRSSASPCSGQAGATKRCGARMPSRSAPLRRAIVSGSSAGGSRGAQSGSTSSGEGTTGKLAALIEGALPLFQAAGDDLALYVAYAALSELEVTRAQMDAALEAFERAYAHAQHAGYIPPGSFGQRAFCRFAGTTPVPELLAWLEENEAREGRDYFFRAYRAGGLAMLGRFDEAARDPRRSAC
jgi:tetratricopeptide (TPR) repeat protein